jgi:hypothetical protein
MFGHLQVPDEPKSFDSTTGSVEYKLTVCPIEDSEANSRERTPDAQALAAAKEIPPSVKNYTKFERRSLYDHSHGLRRSLENR